VTQTQSWSLALGHKIRNKKDATRLQLAGSRNVQAFAIELGPLPTHRRK
jgi:hypothetical protein